MKKYELSQGWITKNNKMIKKAYNIALIKKYDITSQKDVLKILKVVDSKNANKENADFLSKILQLFSFQLGKRLNPKQKVKEKVIN